MCTKKEVREWLNTVFACGVLIVMVYGLLAGLTELQELNVNLKEIKSDIVSAEVIRIIGPGNISSDIFYNESAKAFQLGGNYLEVEK